MAECRGHSSVLNRCWVDPPRRHWKGKKEVRGQARGHEGKAQAEDTPRLPGTSQEALEQSENRPWEARPERWALFLRRYLGDTINV